MFDSNDFEIEADDNEDLVAFLKQEAQELQNLADADIPSDYPEDYEGPDEPEEFTDEELEEMDRDVLHEEDIEVERLAEDMDDFDDCGEDV